MFVLKLFMKLNQFDAHEIIAFSQQRSLQRIPWVFTAPYTALAVHARSPAPTEERSQMIIDTKGQVVFVVHRLAEVYRAIILVNSHETDQRAREAKAF